MRKLLFLFLFLGGILMAEDASYKAMNEIFPGQLRYASKNVQEKMAKKIAKGDAKWNQEMSKWEYAHDEGRSIFTIGEALPVVKASFGFVLVDGHHDVLSSVALGATSIPVKVVGDLSALPEKEFWDQMEKQGLAYLYDLQGVRTIPPRDFSLLQDDPNRYFAAISARKCKEGGTMNNSTGAEYPLWIKVGKDIPFIEFKIADALWKHHVIYNYAMGDTPPEEFMEEARRALVEAQVPGLRVVETRTYYLELECAVLKN